MIIVGAAFLFYGGWLYSYRWEQSNRVSRDWESMNNHGVITGIFIGAGLVLVLLDLLGRTV